MSAVVVPFPGRDPDHVEPLCASHDPAWWFEPELFARAVEVCARCSMRSSCLDQALQAGERLGVWGGLTPEQRLALPDAVVIPMPRRGGGRR
jgi:WhiB family transcriptional regulator, redox-sensing transcriptional regulator